MDKEIFSLKIVYKESYGFDYVRTILQIQIPYPSTQAEQITWQLFNKGFVKILTGTDLDLLDKYCKILNNLGLKTEVVR